MERFNNETGADEKKYVRNVKYMFPKTREVVSTKGHPKTTIQPRELFDLTSDEAGPSAKIQNLCDVIDLDATDYNFDCSSVDSQYFKNFKQRFNANSCPFCQTTFAYLAKFESHIDSCRGFQQKVEFNMKKFKR